VVLDEGEFTNSLNFLKSETTEKEYETKVTLRTVNRAFFLIALASLFTYPMIFEDAELINIFPGFIFASLFVYALFSLRKYVSQKNTTLLISGAAYALISIVAFVLSVNFLTKYDYVDLIKVNFESQNAAKNTYIPVIISSAIELIALAVLFFFAFKYLNAFIKENTGLSPNSERYSRNEADYHKTLTVRLILFFAFGFFAAFLKFIEIYLYLSPKMFFNVAKDDVTNKVLHTSEVVSPAIPWFGVLVTIFSILFIGYTIYFTHIIREEVEMKHKKA
jgi:hypothetical protein